VGLVSCPIRACGATIVEKKIPYFDEFHLFLDNIGLLEILILRRGSEGKPVYFGQNGMKWDKIG
tara:strand:+ start:456 stop:647 length:192 start_codon:yes stop_codon:yes gene_type:complete